MGKRSYNVSESVPATSASPAPENTDLDIDNVDSVVSAEKAMIFGEPAADTVKVAEKKQALPSHLQQLENIHSELKAQTDGTAEHIDATLKRKMQSIFHAIGVFK
jgi:hypothetical protein